MADSIKVQLKDKDGKTLHPETEWSAVQNRPSINNESNNTVISPSGTIRMTGKEMAISVSGDVTISTSDTENKYVSLSNYPINWSALNDRPFQEVLQMQTGPLTGTTSSVQNAILGVYEENNGSMGFTYYPAFAIVMSYDSVPGWNALGRNAPASASLEKIYRLNSNGKLEEVTGKDESKFFGFLKY